jgi:hypothetical protein
VSTAYESAVTDVCSVCRRSHLQVFDGGLKLFKFSCISDKLFSLRTMEEEEGDTTKFRKLPFQNGFSQVSICKNS